MNRKRVRGGGRKPKGQFSQLSSTLTIRIPDDMRKQLESEAVAKNESMAQRLMWHLRQSFNRESDKERDPALQGLLYMIANLAENLSHEGPPSESQTYWRTGWFTFRAFKVAVGKLLDALEEPPVPSHYPFTDKFLKQAVERMVTDGYDREFARSFITIRKSPENLGFFEFSRVWENAHRTAPLSERERQLSHMFPTLERDVYTLPKAWKALELKSKTRKPKDKSQ
jgi:hypothetical protein